MKLLMEQWRQYVDEIEARPSLGTSKEKDNIEFVHWAKKDAEKKGTYDYGDPTYIEHDGLKIQIAKKDDHTKLIAHDENDQPVGYLAIEPFKDGIKIGVVAVGAEYRGQGIAKRLYDYVIQNNDVYSGESQTPESKGLWDSFKNKYNVKAVNVETGEEVPIDDNVYTQEGDDPNNIYLFIPRGGQ